MHFLIDAQLPPALARWLASNGHEATHVADLSMTDASDQSIWAYALGHGLVIVSKDDDFVSRRTMSEFESPQVVWIRFGNASRAETIARFERALPDVVDALAREEFLVEVT